MNRYNDLYIGTNYAVYAPGRRTKSIIDNIITFTDGSEVDLKTGIFNDSQININALTVYELKIGKNNFKFGSYNEDPKTKKWSSNTINIEYSGPIEILQGTSGEVTVEENRYVNAAIETEDCVSILSAEVTEITYIHKESGNVSFTQSTQISGSNKLPVLRVWAGDDITITGKAEAIKFKSVKSIDLDCSVVNGTKAQSITIKSQKDVSINCPTVLDLDINTMGTITLHQTQANKISLKTMGHISIPQTISATNIKFETMGGIEIKCLISESVILKGNSNINIAAGLVTSSVQAKDCMGDVTLHLTEAPTVKVGTMGNVKIVISKGPTITSVNTMGNVSIKLDVAEETTVKTMGNVDINATKYTKKPSISTMGSNNVTNS